MAKADDLLVQVQRKIDIAVANLDRGAWPRGDLGMRRNRALRNLEAASNLLAKLTGVVFDLTEEDMKRHRRATPKGRRAQ